MNDTHAKWIKCPYYKQSKNNQLTCDGFAEDTTCKTQFRNKERMLDYMDDFCKGYPNGCPLCLELDGRAEL